MHFATFITFLVVEKITVFRFVTQSIQGLAVILLIITQALIRFPCETMMFVSDSLNTHTHTHTESLTTFKDSSLAFLSPFQFHVYTK